MGAEEILRERGYGEGGEEATSISSTSTGTDCIIMTPSSTGGGSEASDLGTASSELSESLEGNEEEEEEEGEEGQGMVTVFHSTANFNVKHPLANTWVLWFTQPTFGRQGDNWNELLKEVTALDSVEEFWMIYNNIPRVSALPIKADYHLFKSGVRPEWEDPQNKDGGKWSFMFRERQYPSDIDGLWLDLLLAAIGETLEPDGANEVMGVVANVRKSFIRVGCWTRSAGRDGASKDKLIEIGKNLKRVLMLREIENLEFTGHAESACSGSYHRAKSSFFI